MLEQKFQKLVDVIRDLRDPEHGCPWDREQTHKSLKQYVIEEAYELADAIDESPESIKEELGDVLLQVLLHSQIASEFNCFDVWNVIEDLRLKLIHRHPHVFGDVEAKNADDVLKLWQKVKSQEKGILDGIPQALPALLKLGKVVARIKKSEVNFDVLHGDVITSVSEAVKEPTHEALKIALRDIAIFVHDQGENPEELLQEACHEIISQFKAVESLK